MPRSLAPMQCTSIPSSWCRWRNAAIFVFWAQSGQQIGKSRTLGQPKQRLLHQVIENLDWEMRGDAPMRLIKKSTSREKWLVLQYEIISISFSPVPLICCSFAARKNQAWLHRLHLPQVVLVSSREILKEEFGRMDHCSPHSRDWMQCFGFHVGLTMWFVWFETANFAAACSPCRKITWALKTTVKRINLELCKWLGKKCH